VSKYLEAFKLAATESARHFELVGNNLLVEDIADNEFKTKSGLIISTGGVHQVNNITADKPTWLRVLMVGAGHPEDGTDELVKYDVEPGDIILVGAHSIKYFSVFGQLVTYGEAKLGLTIVEEIQMRFRGQEGFDAFFGTLNQATKAQVELGKSQG
jgi:co-chaperonin GroES (HSP10)